MRNLGLNLMLFIIAIFVVAALAALSLVGAILGVCFLILGLGLSIRDWLNNSTGRKRLVL